MSSQIVAVVRAYDVTWSTQCRIKLSKRSPTIEEQERFIKADAARLKEDIEKAKEDWGNFPLRVASHDQILSHIKKTGSNFIDITFPPTDKAICDPSKGQLFDRVVHWRRPREFM